MSKKTLFSFLFVVCCLLLGSSIVFCDESSNNNDSVDQADLNAKEEIVTKFKNFNQSNFKAYVSTLETSRGLDLAMKDIVESIINGDSSYDINSLRELIESVNLSSPDGIVGLLEIISVNSKIYSAIKENVVLDLLSRLNESLVAKSERKLLNDISIRIVVNMIESGCDDEFLVKLFGSVKLTSETRQYLIKRYADKVISIVVEGKRELEGTITSVDSFLLYDNLLDSNMSQIAHRILEISGKNMILKILERKDINKTTKIEYIERIVGYCQFSSADIVWQILSAFSSPNMSKRGSHEYINGDIVYGCLKGLSFENTRFVYEKLLERNLINTTTMKWVEQDLKNKEKAKKEDERAEKRRLAIEKTNNPCCAPFSIEDIIDQM